MKRIWLLFVTAVSWAQAPLQFDVASVKPVQIEMPASSGITTDPVTLKARSVGIAALIAYAYDLHPAQIVNPKSGLDRYDVEGKADGVHSQADLRVMLQGLLADRFRLKFHREMREIPAERLVIGKDLRLRATELTEADPRGFTLGASERGPGFQTAKASAMSLEWLADSLSGHRSTLVVDGTGLKGLYEFEVDFEIDRAYVTDRNVSVREASNYIHEAIVSALGLQLQGGKKEQVEVLVVDRVERPEAN